MADSQIFCFIIFQSFYITYLFQKKQLFQQSDRVTELLDVLIIFILKINYHVLTCTRKQDIANYDKSCKQPKENIKLPGDVRGV